MLSPSERKESNRVRALLQSAINAEKSKHVVTSGHVASQFGQVILNEKRLIDNGHFMKTGEGARLDYLRETYKKAKKAANKVNEVINVSKRHKK